MKPKDKIQRMLPNFTGTENYYKYTMGLLITDGAKWLADEAQCYWLLDVIASTQLIRKVLSEEFQVHKLKVDLERQSAEFSVEDGNRHTLYTQRITYTDFPLPEITLWLSNGVIFLPSEY